MYDYSTRLLAIVALTLLFGCGDRTEVENPLVPGQTDFTNSEPLNSSWDGDGRYAPAPEAAGEGLNTDDTSNKAAPGEPPQGRTGEVEEADIYRVDNNRLFYLNTYRGFVIYDFADPTKPKRISRLPVYGYPIEMFIEDNTVYALLRDALYLTQKDGKLQFERHNVSQLVSIDISDIKNPKVIKTVDIKGMLREGVSRKIEDTIYVVSYIPQHYYWGWSYNRNDEQKEQAWVYSFNVADPKNLELVNELKVFEGGSYQYNDPVTGASGSRRFSDVAISATSNTLMVVENWYVYGYTPSPVRSCSSYQSLQESVVSIVDISDPKGNIDVYTRFTTAGQLRDQFKMTYVFDKASGKANFFGIFSRQEWQRANCEGGSFTANIIESWDVTDGANPKLVSSLQFGKPNETVRGSAFDTERQVAYAITARRIDPLYVIDISDPSRLSVLSEIDGLSGDMSVFRLIGDRQFLLGIGRDNSEACTGFEDQDTRRATNVAVSIIDVRKLDGIRLVQRQCVAIEDAEWVSSAVTWNLDQAHKMLGMYSDDEVNIISVPVYYYKKDGDGDWWWYNRETAVGLMTWDLSKYDDTKSELDQQVLQNFGTVVHKNGEVRRSIIFKHESSAIDRRMMINLSDTHVSITDIDDLQQPTHQSTIEIAPYVNELFGFGKYMVEHVRAGGYYWASSESMSQFRVKLGGGKIEDNEPVATFSVGQVQRVIKHGNKLVLFRAVPLDDAERHHYYYAHDTEVLVVDLSDPAKPKMGGTALIESSVLPYYAYWCGSRGYWGGYWFDSDRNWTVTDSGVVFLQHYYDYETSKYMRKLYFLDLTDVQNPKVNDYTLTSSENWTFFGLVGDPSDSSSFYLTYRIKIGETTIKDTKFAEYKYYAQRWQNSGKGWSSSYAINLPGQLIRAWSNPAGERLFLTHDGSYKSVFNIDNGNTYWKHRFRLNLLREVDLGGKLAAELRDTHNFADYHLRGLVIDGDKLFVNAYKNWYYWEHYEASGWSDYSDNLMIFDISALELNKTYDEPTGTYRVQLMGTHQGNLFVNLPGDGVLVVDVSDPANPTGTSFMRTLGYASHIEFSGDTAYVASGYFGIYQMDLSGPSVIATY